MVKNGKAEPYPYDEPVWVFPFDGMEVGESFFIPTMKPAQMTTAIEDGAKRAGVRVKTFITTKESVLGVRAWRVR